MSQPKSKTMKPGTFIILALAGWCLISVLAWGYYIHLHYVVVIAQLDKTVLISGGLTRNTTPNLFVRDAVRGAMIEIFGDGAVLKTVEHAGFIPVELDKGDGKYTFTARQKLLYKGEERVGLMSEPVVLILDTLPPTGKLIVNKVPSIISSNEIPFVIKAKAEGADYLVISTPGGRETCTPFSPLMEVDLSVTEGGQTIVMMLGDKAGNRSKPLFAFDVYVDCTKPVVHKLASNVDPFSTDPDPFEGLLGMDSEDTINNPFLEEVWLGFDGTFYGPMEGTVEAPVIGNVKGKLKSLTLDKREIPVNKDGSIKTRIAIPVHRGTMEYEIVALDLAGNVGKTTLELKWGTPDEKTDTDEIIPPPM